MYQVISSFEIIERETGISIPSGLLYPQLSLDAMKKNSPLLVTNDAGEKYLFVKLIEKGNFPEVSDNGVKVVYYAPYFTFSDPGVVVDGTLFDALAALPGEKIFIVDQDLPYAIFLGMQERFPEVTVKLPEPAVVYVHTLIKKDIAAAFINDGDVLVSSKAFETKCSQAEFLVPSSNEMTINRFSSLQDMLAQQNLKGLLAASPLNLQELTGIPISFFKGKEALVCYQADSEHVYLLVTDIIEGHSASEFPSMREALAAVLPQGSIGIEEEALPLWQALVVPVNDFTPCSAILRRWRELLAVRDLPYYIIAAQCTRQSMESALSQAREMILGNEEITEKDVDELYKAAIRTYNENIGIDIKIEPYFIVLHTGKRTHYPNLAQAYRLNDVNCVKLDSGVLVFDKAGLLRACSDLCRTLVLSAEGCTTYQMLIDTMHKVIDGIKDGASGEEMHAIALVELQKHEKMLKEIDMLPQEFPLSTGYSRNIGHAMGKQEPSSIIFEGGNKNRLAVGMVGCVEFQWPYKDYCIGIEDMFYISEKGPVNIS